MNKDTKNVIEYNVTEASIEEMKKKAGAITKIITKEDRESAYSVLKVVKKTRTGIEKKRKELVADALEHQRKVNSIAKDITAKIKEIEEPLALKITRWDEALEAKKEAERKKEEARVQAHYDKIEEMTNLGVLSFGDGSKEIKSRLEKISELEDLKPDMEEFEDEYVTARCEAVAKLTQALEVAISTETAAAKLEEEKKKLEEERKKLEEEKAKADADTAELATLRTSKESGAYAGIDLAQQDDEEFEDEPEDEFVFNELDDIDVEPAVEKIEPTTQKEYMESLDESLNAQIDKVVQFAKETVFDAKDFIEELMVLADKYKIKKDEPLF